MLCTPDVVDILLVVVELNIIDFLKLVPKVAEYTQHVHNQTLKDCHFIHEMPLSTSASNSHYA